MKKIFKKKHKIRKVLLQNLYSWEITKNIQNNTNITNSKKINQENTKKYLTKIIEKNSILNLIINIHAKNLQNIKIIDNIIIKIALFELIFNKETPQKVVINEALELSKKFSNKKSYLMINKIIDKIIKST
jgi:N utilization substance protein B